MFSIFKIDFLKDLAVKFHLMGDVDIDVDKRKTEIDTLNQIEKQFNLNAPITGNNLFVFPNVKDPTAILSKVSETPAQIPAKSTGEAELPQVKEDDVPAKLLKGYTSEYEKNPAFLLDIGRLLFFYENRNEIDLNKQELKFLLQSSLKCDFPFWYWSFLYREKFDNVVPLLRETFKNDELKIRLQVVEVMGRFTNTYEDIVELAQTENSEIVLGAMVVKLFEKKEESRAQRIISNAISRNLVPDLDYKDIKTLNAQLGANEKKFLYDLIKNGWANEKIKAINILSATISDEDLLMLEDLLENKYGRDVMFSVLHCIARIGKTNKNDFLKEQLEEERWEKMFFQLLETLVAVRNTKILPKLFEWLKDSSSFAWKFSHDLDTWKLNGKLEDAILILMNKEFYEVVINDILSIPDNEYRHLYTWRQFHILKDVKKREIVELIKQETRLKEHPEWNELIQEVYLNEAIERNNKEELIALATPKSYKTAMLALRQLWMSIDQEEGLSYRHIIESLRQNLSERLKSLSIDDDCTQEQKELASNNLDFFLGENRLYNRLYGKRGSTKEKENNNFSKFNDDADALERIEEEYALFILKRKDSLTKQFLLDYVGRPYEKVYDEITTEWIDLNKEDVKKPLEDISNSHSNPLLVIAALSAGKRLGVFNDSTARSKIIEIIEQSGKELKTRPRNKDSDEWFTNHNIYYRAIRALAEIGNIEDFKLVEESVNSETVLFRRFFLYSNFHHIWPFKKLFQIIDTTKNEEERESALSTLDQLDYGWTQEILEIEN